MTADLRRRRILMGAAAASLAPFAPNVLAQGARTITVPTVDSLTIRVLTDSSYDTPRAGSSKWVKTRRAGLVSPTNVRKTLHNEWGLSLALESKIGSDTRHLLLDFGYTPNALNNNLEVLGIDPARFHALVASHGHYDHFGGLIGFLEQHRGKLPADLQMYIGGEDLFCTRKTAVGAPGHFADWGVLDRRDLDKHRIRIVSCEQPTVVMGHAFTTGTIDRTSFEKVLPNTLVEYFKKDGLGCDIPSANAKAGGKAVQDEHIHEHGTCFNLKDRGLVVISSCGHAGIVNTVQQAIKVTGIKKVHAALGGFHLFPATDEYVRTTVEALTRLDPDVIIPMHCSGPSIVALLRTELADRVMTSTTGTEFTFGA